MWFQALLGWFTWAVQSVASAHRRLHEVNPTSFKLLGEANAASFAPRCPSHTRVLSLKPHMIGTLLEIVPGQVVQAILLVLRKSAELRLSSMGSGNRCQAVA